MAIRVLVVEDSLTVRKRIVEILSATDEFEVVGEAADGSAGIERCRELRPDVMTLDMMMPVMTGLQAVEHIMAHFPTPILIVSASTNRGELFRTYEALAAGAVDVLEKPLGDEDEGAWAKKLRSALRIVSRIKVITHPRGRLGGLGRPRAAPEVSSAAGPAAGPHTVLAVGASTGGPGAVSELLRALPAPFSAPILLVVHIGAPFGAAFAEWLDGQSRHKVLFAKDGELLGEAPRVLLAPPEAHLVLEGRRLRLSDADPLHSCRPSVDALFESVARSAGAGAVGCLLTGMGRDGATGLLAIKRAGGATIAQDEASSVVWGMPREAVLIGAAERVLPLSSIGPAVTSLFAERPR